MVKKPKSLQLRMTYPEDSEAYREYQAANEDARFIRMRHYELVKKGRELEALAHAGLYDLPEVQVLLQTIGVRKLPVPRLALVTSMSAVEAHRIEENANPAVASVEEVALPASADTGTDMESSSTSVNPYPGLDVSQWM